MIKQGIQRTEKITPVPVMRAWHVVTGNGGDTTVIAHLCHTFNGILTFERYEPDERNDRFDKLVVVRAFSRCGWKDVELVNVDEAKPAVKEGVSGHHDQ